jgi:cytochrome P450
MTAQPTASTSSPTRPAHVPPELVIPFSFHDQPGMDVDPFAVYAALRDMPRAFYTFSYNQRPNGAWVLTRAEDIRHAYQTPDLFSSKGGAGFFQLAGEDWDMIPLELDPPQHTAYRALLNPIFAPAKINALDAGVRETAVTLISVLAANKGCEFMTAFGRPFPISVFLRLLGLPQEEAPKFVGWEAELLHSPTREEQAAGARKIIDYLMEAIEDRRANPRDDLITFCVGAEVGGRKLTPPEIIGICFLLYVGGLDTVASSLGFFFKHLAENQEAQMMLRNDRSLIPNAIEEMLRAFSVVISHRQLTRDAEFAGVAMKKGEWVMLGDMIANRDPHEFPDPDTLDLGRSPNRHVAFAYGPHRCVGSHLARREFVVALNEWFDRVPPFSIAPGSRPVTHGAPVLGVDELKLVW